MRIQNVCTGVIRESIERDQVQLTIWDNDEAWFKDMNRKSLEQHGVKTDCAGRRIKAIGNLLAICGNELADLRTAGRKSTHRPGRK